MNIKFISRFLVASGFIFLFAVLGPETEDNFYWRLWVSTVARPSIIRLMETKDQSSDDRKGKDEKKS